MDGIKPFTDTEKKCLKAGCPHFICWEYWGTELHSCELQGQSDTINGPADSDECKIKKS